MPWSLRWQLALRQTLDPGKGLSAFLSRVSIVGIALAIALLLAVQSVMNGFDREMRERILALIPHVQITSNSALTEWQPLQAELAADPAVSSLTPFINADGLLMRGQTVAATRLTGIEADALLAYGDLLMPAVTDWNEQSLVLGAALASRLSLKQSDRVTFILPGGAESTYAPLTVTLTSILDSGTELDEVLALVHRRTLLPFVGGASVQEGLAVQLHDVFAAGSWRWSLYQSVPSQLQVTDWRGTHGNLYSAIQLSRDLVGLILFIVIFVAAFNVVSSLMLVVTDRRKGVAMLMALGGKGRDIALVFFLQGGLIGLVGAALGAALGYALASLAPDAALFIEQWLEMPLLQTDVYPLSFVPVDIRWQDFAITSAIAVSLSVLAATLPAMRASSLPIAETLAH